MSKAFFLFRDGRRLIAAHADVPNLDGPILIGGNRFNPAGGLLHWCHLTDSQKRLVGFTIDSLEKANSSPQWRAWWDSFDNREMIDFFEASIFLADPMPADCHNDCSLLIGGWVYEDGKGNFALAIPDENGISYRPNEFNQFWLGFGFDAAHCDVTVAV